MRKRHRRLALYFAYYNSCGVHGWLSWYAIAKPGERKSAGFGNWRELRITKFEGDEIGNRETGRTLARVYLAVRPGVGIGVLRTND